MATFGKKWNEPGPWAKESSVHQIKGGPSRAKRLGSLKATRKQLDYLEALGYTGDPDLTRLEASDHIANLKKRRT